MVVDEKTRTAIRDLAKRVAGIAADPVHDEKRRMWTDLNGLKPVRPLVWINEIPWGELIKHDEFVATDGTAAWIEGTLRRTLYKWENMPGDMVVDGKFFVPLAVGDSGFGLQPKTRSPDGVGSCEFIPIMKTDADIEKLTVPVVTHDEAATERSFQEVCDLIGDILKVEKQGIATTWFAAWDELVRYWGVEQLYTDMYDRPDFVNRGVSRVVDCCLARLRQWQEQNLLAVGNGNHRVGSNGLGFTDDLPQPDCDPERVRPIDQWGTATGQVFSEVSPEQHWEFCLRHEMRWLEQFGLNNYGCCEPLHNKMDLIRKIPRLRKVSMSPKADKAKAAEEIGTAYVIAIKPNPAVFAPDKFNADVARKAVRDDLEPLRGCRVEIILKDITTVRNDPPRLHAWEKIAMEVAEEFAP